MISFQVNDMTCGHCVSQITRAVKAADAGAVLDFDLASHQVRIKPALADVAALGAAISAAGYTPALTKEKPQEPANARLSPAAPVRSGCCCG